MTHAHAAERGKRCGTEFGVGRLRWFDPRPKQEVVERRVDPARMHGDAVRDLREVHLEPLVRQRPLLRVGLQQRQVSLEQDLG